MSEPAPDFVVRLSELTSANIEWLWPGRLALGKPTFLDGDPQEGKSLLTLDWTARLTTARPWPDGPPIPEPVPVLLLADEDDAEDTIIPRLLAAGADLNLVHLFRGRRNADGSFCPPLFPEDTPLLRAALRKTAARFVVADPIISFLGPSAGLNGPQVRTALTPLADAVHDARANLTMVRHLNKNDGRQSALYRGTGSIQGSARARIVLLAGRDPDDLEFRLLACTKNNLAPPPPTLSYRIRRNDDGLPFLAWGEQVAVRADDIVLAAGMRFGASLPRAVEFLRDTLTDDMRPSKEILDLARDLGISRRTLDRARTDLNVVPCQIRENGRNVWYWRIRHGATADEEAANFFHDLHAPAPKVGTHNELPGPCGTP